MENVKKKTRKRDSHFQSIARNTLLVGNTNSDHPDSTHPCPSQEGNQKGAPWLGIGMQKEKEAPPPFPKGVSNHHQEILQKHHQQYYLLHTSFFISNAVVFL